MGEQKRAVWFWICSNAGKGRACAQNVDGLNGGKRQHEQFVLNNEWFLEEDNQL